MDIFNRIFKPKVVYKQHKWTDAELKADGFRYFYPIKRVTMARQLPQNEAPKRIKTSWDTIIAQAGSYIAYVAGNTLKSSLDDYEPRPIEPHIFHDTYTTWNEPGWKPTATESHLMRMGCKPYYKTAGVWAKRLTASTLVQSMESPVPSVAPAGAWLCIGVAGEPWSVTDDWFRFRYIIPDRHPSKPAINR
ncbi:MAG: hypothetical protein K8L97_09990 [Anaerolineae bacterium]|nr:hypothetical protein [Anaerolineae bacterium]